MRFTANPSKTHNMPPAQSYSQKGGHEISSVEQARLVPKLIIADTLHMVFTVYTMFGPMTALLLAAFGLTKSQIGAVLAILPLSAIAAVLIGPLLSRLGAKTVCKTTYLLRKLALIPLLLTPWIAAHFGSSWIFPWVLGIISFFGVVRAFAEASAYGWGQELLNSKTRGKVVAMITSATTVMALAASFVGSILTARIPGLNGYLILFAIGIIFGLIYVAILSTYPGGRPTGKTEHVSGFFDGLILPFRDRNFVAYLAVSSLLNISIGYSAFLPIYLVERLGMSSSQVFVFDMFSRVGILLCAFFWGLSADRFGSRPIMIFGLAIHGLGIFLYPCLPDHSRWTAPLAYGVAFILTGVWMAYASGNNRYLFARAVPNDKRNPYMIVYYSVTGSAAALGPLFAGWFLQHVGNWNFNIAFLRINAFTCLVMTAGICMILASILTKHLAADTHKGSNDFFSVFTRGSFFMALESSLRFHYAVSEVDRITTTERLGQARSAMNQEEALEALSDPSFNVRYEAILSITRLPPTERILEALAAIIRSQEPELSMTAAWALGRIGDQRALPELRAAITSEYALLRARIARTLGVLKDYESIDLLSKGFMEEDRDTLRVAYAGALGALRDTSRLPEIMELLKRLQNVTLRLEILFAAARILGGEHNFMRLWRAARVNYLAASADAMLSLTKRFSAMQHARGELHEAAAACAKAWVKEDATTGLTAFIQCLALLEQEAQTAPIKVVLKACRDILSEHGMNRGECVMLGLHAMTMALVDFRANTRNPKRID